MGTNTGLGIGIGIPFKNNALGGDKPYFPPELKARMIGVWTNYGKKNTDADRNIIKNKIPNAGGDLEILNAAYKLNSGFGKYSEDFTTWTKSSKITSVDSESFDFVTNVNWNLLYYRSNIGKDIPSFKVHIKLKGEGKVFYNYITSEGVFTNKVITSEEYVVPISYNTKYTGETPVNCGFSIGVTSEECSGTITQIPNFEDAFVTDGINDMIISQKTLQEMGVTKELTIVSMIHQISWRNSASIPLTNYIRNGDTFIRNSISNIGKTGIYGYTCFNIKNVNSSASKVINNILGDKNDYIVEYRGDILSKRFSVQGYIDANGNILETSSVAHYWTFAVLGKATEDEINLIIGNYNLDRSLKPDILCNIGKQGITNDNHAEFNDKLIDYSGNGRDIQMNNLAWKGGSGIAAKQYETFKDWTSESSSTSIITQIDEFTRIVESTTNGYWVSRIRRDSDLNKVYDAINVYLYQDNNFLVHECKYEVDGIKYAIPINESVGKGYHKLEMYTKDRYTELPENAENVILSEWYFPKSTKGSIKYSIIPSCKGGILLDGINDFGKVIDMPIYKDYTFIIDREIISIGNTAGIVASKSEDSTDVNKQGAFLFEYLGSPNNVSAWSFYKDNGKVANTDFTRGISYQSKYSYNGIELLAGTALDSDKLWLGILRDKDSRFANVAIYSLMTFPYSMSEFLIERQLKKHKLGTLYPDMVEFRPIIKSNVNYQDIIFRNTSTGENLIVGQYYNLESISIYVKPLYYEEVSTIKVNNINAEFNSYDKNTGYYRFDCIVTKSPQKINLTIEQDENYVKFEPVIKSNASYDNIVFYYKNEKVENETYLTVGSSIGMHIRLSSNPVNEIKSITINGIPATFKFHDANNNIYQYDFNLTSKSPQKINITIDEYIRYEDIVQPYPVLLRFNDENGNEVSWGGKFRVGSTITRIGSFYENNLIDGLYIVRNPKLNGNNLNTPTHVVEKSMVFTCDTEYLLDNNEPKCILSPSRLRMPNSSYKILGYIPDISGHGNHGKINNSAYAGMSGVNGYPVVFGANETWENLSSVYGYTSDVTSTTIHITRVKNAGTGLLFSYVKKDGALTNIREIPAFRVTVKGLEGNSKFGYRYLATEDATIETLVYLGNGTHELSKSFTPTEALLDLTRNAWVGIFITPMVEGEVVFDCDITIEVLPEYEGAYCLDGVDDFVTIPTTVGGKQVLMKVNWDSSNSALLYDQRGYNNEFAIYNGSADSDGNPIPAYQGRNNGQTYIDGILNSNIKASELKAITHNITITNELSLGINNTYPVIGSTRSNTHFAQMSLYDFMLFDEISTDDKIKELNKYVGVEAKVELPPYYWDTYGKTNSDADRDVIQQRGIAVGDYDLTNYNHAYDKMSGYGGYKFAKFDNELDWYLTPDNGYIDVVSRNGYSITLRNLSTSNYGWYFQNSTVKEFITKDIPFKVKANKSIRVYWDMHSYKSNGENFGYVVNNITLNPNEDTSINLRHLTEEELTELDANKDRMYYLLWFDLSTLAVDEEVTIEMLPLYPNGLAYDGITDYSKNANIPVLTDYTYIYKRTIINIPTNAATLLKGADKTNGGAFIADYGNKWQFNFGQYNIIQGIADGINWQTVNSFNGTSINKGENTDDSGITVAKFSNGYTSMVFYKLILYPKTISLLEINFLKNLMEKDEIIDLNNPIFIKNE